MVHSNMSLITFSCAIQPKRGEPLFPDGCISPMIQVLMKNKCHDLESCVHTGTMAACYFRIYLYFYTARDTHIISRNILLLSSGFFGLSLTDPLRQNPCRPITCSWFSKPALFKDFQWRLMLSGSKFFPSQLECRAFCLILASSPSKTLPSLKTAVVWPALPTFLLGVTMFRYPSVDSASFTSCVLCAKRTNE